MLFSFVEDGSSRRVRCGSRGGVRSVPESSEVLRSVESKSPSSRLAPRLAVQTSPPPGKGSIREKAKGLEEGAAPLRTAKDATQEVLHPHLGPEKSGVYGS